MEETKEEELDRIFLEVVSEMGNETNEKKKIYLQGKKDGIRISQVVLIYDTLAAHGVISSPDQSKIPDSEYNISLAVADGRRRKE